MIDITAATVRALIAERRATDAGFQAEIERMGLNPEDEPRLLLARRTTDTLEALLDERDVAVWTAGGWPAAKPGDGLVIAGKQGTRLYVRSTGDEQTQKQLIASLLFHTGISAEDVTPPPSTAAERAADVAAWTDGKDVTP